MNKIAKNYIYNLIYQLIALVVPLITVPYVVRVIGADGTGIYSYVNSVTAMLTTFVMLGFYTYGNRQIAYVRDDDQKLNDTFWRIMTCRFIVMIIGTAIFAVTVAVINKYTVPFILYYTYMLGYFVDCTWLFVGVEDMKWAVLKNIFLKLFATAMIFIFVRDANDTGLYIFIQGGSILFANLLAYTQLKRYVGKPKFVFKGIKKDFYNSVLLFLPGVASTIYLQCDKIMLEMLGKPIAQVSQYDYAEKIVNIALSFITVLSTVMMPRIANEFAQGRKSKIEELLCRAAKVSLFLACPLMLGMMIVANKLIPWYLGDEFLPSVKVIIIISPIIISNTLTGISGSQYFTATNQIKILLISQISACVGNIAANALLIPKFGLYGAAVATLVSSFVCAIIQYAHLCRQVKLKGVGKSAAKYLLFSIIMAAAVWIASRNLSASIVTNIIQVAIGFVVYLVLCLIFKDEVIMEFVSKIKAVRK